MKINWREPKLLLKERREMLLIAGDRRGLFFGIPEHDFGSSLKGIFYIIITNLSLSNLRKVKQLLK